MLRILGEKLFEQVLSMLPGFLARKIVKVQQVQQFFEIDLASPTPVKIRLNAVIPEIEICLRITNKNTFPVSVDRILYEVWIGQPFLDSARLRRFTLKPRETNGYVPCRFFLSEVQRTAIKNQLDDKQRLNPSLTIHTMVFCDCKIGSFEIMKDFRIERDGVPIS